MSWRLFSGVVLSCLVSSGIIFQSAFALTIDVLPGELISEALASAASGDTVVVHCGTYFEQGLQMVDGVTLRSESGKAGCVTIASAGGEPILTCENLVQLTRIEGLIFTSIAGGLTTNVARGAGLFIQNANPFVSQCLFRDLAADYGGAIYCGANSTPPIVDCEFVGNIARGAGGAINCVGTAAPYLVRCLLVSNWAASGGAALNVAHGAQPHLISCTIADNSGTAVGAWQQGNISMDRCIVVGSAWTGDLSAVPAVSCSDIYSPYEFAWTGLLAGQAGANGNISVDPLFCEAVTPELQFALTDDSPCGAAAMGECGAIGAVGTGCAVSGVGAGNLPGAGVVLVTELTKNFPNPFNPSTTIRYNLQRAGALEIVIYDIAGRLVNRLVDGHSPAGSFEVQWHGRDQADQVCAAGVYFVRLKTEYAQDTSRLSLIK